MITILDLDKRNEIVRLYKSGLSSYEIKELIDLPITTRQIQRILKKQGVTRSRSEAYQLAVDKGRMDYTTKAKSIRYCPHCNNKLW
jgi:DNA-binding NarL/FixJ family response regulator